MPMLTYDRPHPDECDRPFNLEYTDTRDWTNLFVATELICRGEPCPDCDQPWLGHSLLHLPDCRINAMRDQDEAQQEYLDAM